MEMEMESLKPSGDEATVKRELKERDRTPVECINHAGVGIAQHR
jgi:hypothetical protein